MTVWIDADGCPVVAITVRVAREFGVPCTIVCDTAHTFEQTDSVTVLTVSQGADSADFALVNRIGAGDVVVTQDYGLAAMCLARRAVPIHQNGWVFTENNIDGLLHDRYAAKKERMAGGRLRGPAKRKPEQNEAFEKTLREVLQARSPS